MRIQGNFVTATTLISSWAQRGAGFFGTLKQALSASAFSIDFDALREELIARVADIQLYLAVRLAVDADRWRRADAKADREDRAALPVIIANEADDGARVRGLPAAGAAHVTRAAAARRRRPDGAVARERHEP